MARHIGTVVAGIVSGGSIELIGNEREIDLIRLIISPENLENGATKSAVT